MGRLSYIWIIVFTFCVCAFNTNAQDQAILDFDVKDMDGNVSPFKDILDPNTNYLIETMAFWCIPCRRSMDEFSYHRQYWKDRFNLEIIMIDDEHFGDLEYVRLIMERNNWDLNIVMSDGEFSSAGITSIPRYFFKSSVSDTLERVTGFKEHFLLERLDSIYYSPILMRDFEQSKIGNGCNVSITEFNNTDTIVNDLKYYKVNNLLLREDDQNGNLIRYNRTTEAEQYHIKYSAPLCSRVWMSDRENDSLEVKILDRYQVDGRLHLETDQSIINTCTGETIPFMYIQGLGTNAGLDFDISDDKITTQLVCHKVDGLLTYSEPSLDQYCELTSIGNPADQLISIYPNPSLDYLIINHGNNNDGKIKVYSVSGQLLLEQELSQNTTTVDISQLPEQSIYLIEIATINGKYVEKIVKI